MHRIKSVGVMSVAKVMGLIYGALGLLVVPIFLVIGLASSMAMKQAQAATGANIPAAIGPIFAIFMAIAAPIFYGLMGFVTGAISALIYNLIAGWVGGIEMELEIAPIQHVLPVPPPQPPLPQAPLA
jgi:hypothetical protein